MCQSVPPAPLPRLIKPLSAAQRRLPLSLPPPKPDRFSSGLITCRIQSLLFIGNRKSGPRARVATLPPPPHHALRGRLGSLTFNGVGPWKALSSRSRLATGWEAGGGREAVEAIAKSETDGRASYRFPRRRGIIIAAVRSHVSTSLGNRRRRGRWGLFYP
jgi:hypothetical protein